MCLFFLACIAIIVYLSHFICKFYTHDIDSHTKHIYEANLCNNNFNNFNKFVTILTILKCSVELDFEFNVTVDSCINTRHKIKHLSGFKSREMQA